MGNTQSQRTDDPPSGSHNDGREGDSTDATAADDAAAQNPLRSTSRLHDDELSCVMVFLRLKEVATLVRCSHRFNGIARKERSRELHMRSDATIAPMTTSPLSHHIISLHLARHVDSKPLLTLSMLRQLRHLPHLMAMQLTIRGSGDIQLLMEGLSLEAAAAGLRAVLPPQLRSFSVVLGSPYSWLDEHSVVLASSFWDAADGMTQLTELCILQFSREPMRLPRTLAQLPQLRKLMLGPAGEKGEHVAEGKQLSQLRELVLFDDRPDRIRLLCQPPHALQLESLSLPSTRVDEDTIQALLHLPTLTALDPDRIQPDAWPMLAQLPRLRCLRFSPSSAWTSDRLSSFCAALSRCSSLEDLTLSHMDPDMTSPAKTMTVREVQERWAQLLPSVPNLRRMGVHMGSDDLPIFFRLLPLHLPRLESLALSNYSFPLGAPLQVVGAIVARLAHPNLRQLEFGDINSGRRREQQPHACNINSKRLPKLERCVFH